MHGSLAPSTRETCARREARTEVVGAYSARATTHDRGEAGVEREHSRVKRTRSVAAYLGGVRVWVLGTKNFDG